MSVEQLKVVFLKKKTRWESQNINMEINVFNVEIFGWCGGNSRYQN